MPWRRPEVATVKTRSLAASLNQARIHTGFHRFTEIDQIFHNKYIFNNNKKLSTLKCKASSEETGTDQILAEWRRKIQKIWRWC